MFYFEGSFFSPATSVLTSNFLEELGSVLVPSSEIFDDQWLEKYSLGSTMVEMRAAFRRLQHLNGSAGNVSGAMEDRLLSW